MGVHTRRVQAVLTEDQYQTLADLSAREHKPVSALIREAVEQVYLAQAQLERRRAALAELLSLNAPAADWEQMEEEIIQEHIRD